MTVKPGECQCGCGNFTKPASRNDKRKGWVKGEPLRYRAGHNLRGVRRTELEPQVDPRPEPNYYPEAAAKQFIHYLLCWKHWGYRDAIFRRDPDEYRAILQKVINQERTDRAGEHEIAAAKRELKALGEI